MKQFISLSLLALIIGFGSISYAQPPGKPDGPRKMMQMDPENRAQQMTDKLAEQLTLTVEQKTAIKEANLIAANKNQELMEQMKTLRSEMQRVNREREEAINAVLTDEQKEQLEAAKAERREEMKERGMERRQQWQQRQRGMQGGSDSEE